MDSVRFNRSELVGTSKSKTAIVETLIKAYALNRTGNIDYNKYVDCIRILWFLKTKEHYQKLKTIE